MFWAVDVSSNYCTERNTPYKSCIERDEEIWSQNNFGYTHICLWLRALSGPELGYIQVLRTTVRGNCQSYEKIVKSCETVIHTGYSCYLSLDMGPGAAACGMEIEINTGYSCYLSVVRRSRGRFFSPIGSGPGGSGLWNGDRDKHWVQLLFISGHLPIGDIYP